MASSKEISNPNEDKSVAAAAAELQAAQELLEQYERAAEVLVIRANELDDEAEIALRAAEDVRGRLERQSRAVECQSRAVEALEGRHAEALDSAMAAAASNYAACRKYPISAPRASLRSMFEMNRRTL